MCSEFRAISSSGECSFIKELLRGRIFFSEEECLRRRTELTLNLSGIPLILPWEEVAKNCNEKTLKSL